MHFANWTALGRLMGYFGLRPAANAGPAVKLAAMKSATNARRTLFLQQQRSVLWASFGAKRQVRKA
jgi:hypothetical protein